MLSALPRQPEHLGLVLCGDWSQAGWWGAARPVDWSDAIRLAQAIANAVGVTLEVEPTFTHPGTPAAVRGFRPTGLWWATRANCTGRGQCLRPACPQCRGRTRPLGCSWTSRSGRAAPEVSTFPVAKEDVALVVDEGDQC